MKKWETQNNFQFSIFNFQLSRLIQILLENRGIKMKKEIEEFLHPKLENVTVKTVGIDKNQLEKAIKRIKKAITNKEKIIVFGDYDVDGICGTAILWETLHGMGANVMPYIPHRIDEGYGLSVKGIQSVILNSFQDPGASGKEMPKQVRHDNGVKLIITVDNGIVAHEAVEFANKARIDVVITDHHVPSKKLPKAHAIVHTTKLCGTSVAYLLSRVILNSFQDLNKKEMLNQVQHDKEENDHLALVALATVADLVPLTRSNRTLLANGLESLRKTKRPGVVALCEEAGIDQKHIGTYEIGHVIAPRLNAMGRLEYAMESLRLLCTKDKNRAKLLADKLGSTNKERQTLTIETVQHAISKFRIQNSEFRIEAQGSKKIIFIAEESYQQGVIGLVAGRLVEEFYRPSIVVSKGEMYSKASARSISGFNIIEFIRSASDLLVDAGGHPMAAGFTVETAKLVILQETLEKKAEKLLSEEMLTRSLRVDCELSLLVIDEKLYSEVQTLSPFGMGNPEPTFVSHNVVIKDMRLVGKEGKHVKFRLACHPELVSGSDSGSSTRMTNEMPKQVRHDKGIVIDGIGFGLGEKSAEFHVGDSVDIVYTIDENVWNGSKTLQLKVKDIKRKT